MAVIDGNPGDPFVVEVRDGGVKNAVIKIVEIK